MRPTLLAVELTCSLLLTLGFGTQAFAVDAHYPDEGEIRQLLDSGKHARLTEILDGISAKPANTLSEEALAFTLQIAQDSIAYRASITEDDYALMLKASGILSAAGSTGIKYQSVLVNTLAQDTSLFDGMKAETQAEYRTKTLELFVSIYEEAFRKLQPNFDIRGALRPFEINEDLLQEMISSGVIFDQNGRPSGDKFAGNIKVRYEAAVEGHAVRRATAIEQQNIRRILDPDKAVLVRRIFTERYRRPPINYHEALGYLNRIKGMPIRISDIMCAIEAETQIKIPKEYNIECGGKFGTNGDF